jgi:hypothetical protein
VYYWNWTGSAAAGHQVRDGKHRHDWGNWHTSSGDRLDTLSFDAVTRTGLNHTQGQSQPHAATSNAVSIAFGMRRRVPAMAMS